MDQAKYLEMVKRNPYTLEHIENPSEDIMLEAVRRNGMVLQYIKNPPLKVAEAAIENEARAIQFLPDPPADLAKRQFARAGPIWNTFTIRHENSLQRPFPIRGGPLNMYVTRMRPYSWKP